MIIKYNNILIKNYLLFLFSLNSYYTSFLSYFFFKYNFFFNSVKFLNISSLIVFNCRLMDFIITKLKILKNTKKKYLVLKKNTFSLNYHGLLWFRVKSYFYYTSRLI